MILITLLGRLFVKKNRCTFCFKVSTTVTVGYYFLPSSGKRMSDELKKSDNPLERSKNFDFLLHYKAELCLITHNNC